MRCDRSRELISALLDGEGAGRPDELRRHLDGCAGCRGWAVQARSLHRSLRLQPAPEVPDLTTAILRRRLPDRRRRCPRPVLSMPVLRAVLGVVAGTQLVLGVPELLSRAGMDGHATRHLGGWDVAFAVGLLVVAVQPWRARGLLPMAAAVAGVMVVTVVVDAVSGGSPGMAEATHALEVCGVAVLWAITRVEVARGFGGGGWERFRAFAQTSAMPSCAEASAASSSRMIASRARATRDRTVPTGQSQADAVSA
jgi:predicted anti-sigma-YlaC factor YlaD